MNDELNIIYMKLVSGEEVIAMLYRYTDTVYTIKHPMKIFATLNNEGSPAIGFAHLMPFSEDNLFNVKVKDVMMISYQPLTSVIEHYVKHLPNLEESKPH